MNFQFSDDYTLQNDSVFLRPLIYDDIQYLLPFALNELSLWTYSLQSAAGEEAMNNYVQNAINSRFNQKEYPFIVFDKKSGHCSGCTRFYDIQPLADTVQLGFTWYGKDFQGTGLNKHCKYLLLEFAFEKMEVCRVEFRADLRNKRSIAAMKSIGCVQEGILRNHLYLSPTTRRSSIVFSILKEEWFHSVKQLLSNRINT